MSANLDIIEKSNFIDIQDIDKYSVEVNNLTSAGTLHISNNLSSADDAIINKTTIIRTISLPADELTIIDITTPVTDTVSVESIVTDVVEVSSNISFVKIASEAATRTLARSTARLKSPWTSGSNAELYYTKGNVGIGLTDPKFDLEVSDTLFAPVISASRMQIQGLPDNAGVEGLFIVQINRNDVMQSKFVVDLNGVTVLGAFDETPPAKTGGMFFSSSGDFYLGF